MIEKGESGFKAARGHYLERIAKEAEVYRLNCLARGSQTSEVSIKPMRADVEA
jgi:hypothetical protein